MIIGDRDGDADRNVQIDRYSEIIIDIHTFMYK